MTLLQTLLFLLLLFVIVKSVPNGKVDKNINNNKSIDVPPANFKPPSNPKPQNRPPSQYKKIQVSDDSIKKLCCCECRKCKDNKEALL